MSLNSICILNDSKKEVDNFLITKLASCCEDLTFVLKTNGYTFDLVKFYSVLKN